MCKRCIRTSVNDVSGPNTPARPALRVSTLLFAASSNAPLALRRVAGSLNGTSASRLASASASPIVLVLVVVLVLDLFARIEAAHSNAEPRARISLPGRTQDRLPKAEDENDDEDEND